MGRSKAEMARVHSRNKKKAKAKLTISKKLYKLPVKRLNSQIRKPSPINVGIIILLIMIILAVWAMEGYGD